MTTGLGGTTRTKFVHDVYFGRHNSVMCTIVERAGGYDVQFCDASNPETNKHMRSFEAADYNGSLDSARAAAKDYARTMTK